MATRVASILAEIGIDASKFNAGAAQVQSGLQGIAGSFTQGMAVAAAYAGAIALVTDQYWKAVDAATEAARAQAKLDAVLKATGNAAGLTSEELGVMAEELAAITGIDDEVIKSTEAMMLTFKNIKGDNFRLAMEAAADLSAVMDGDLKGSAIQVSKALNDFSGYTALRRAGVSFSETQERQIKNFRETNNLAAYQALVLKELQSEFGGAAGAINAAGDGSDNLNIAIGNLYENIGTLLLPEVRNFNRELTQLLTLINRNWEGITRLWQALVGVQRVVTAISSLGISEVIRWWMGGGGDKAPGTTLDTPSNTWQHAIGGTFLIPQSYGNEGFKLGNGDTASAGERITITPAYAQGGMGANVTITNMTIGDTSNWSRSDIEEMMRKAILQVAA